MIGNRQETPDLIEPLIGYRSWQLERGRLKGIVHTVEWESLTKASCRRHKKHAVPDPDCSCGLYAFHRPDIWLRVYSGLHPAGAVKMWGRCEVHQDGIRSEYAQPVIIAKPSRLPTRLSFSFGILNLVGCLGLVLFMVETSSGFPVLLLGLLGVFWLGLTALLGIGLGMLLKSVRKELDEEVARVARYLELEVVKYRNLKKSALKYGKPFNLK